jgi:5'-3' exonuclease
MADGSMTQSPPIVFIDASIYIFQYYFSLPDHWFSETDQWPTAAVYGYTAFLLRLLKDQQPKRIAACFDESLSQCFRNAIYPAYKSSRALPDEALVFQLAACKQVTELLGISSYASSQYEADDLLGCLYRQCQRSPSAIAILTRDKDLGQLLTRPQDFLWDYSSKGKDKFFVEDIAAKFGVHPNQLIDYLALVGDPVDDIPGVPSIGKKTAQQLLQHFGSIDYLFRQIDTVENIPIRGAKRIRENLQRYREQIIIAQQLATIVTNIPLINSVNDLNKRPIQCSQFKRFCQQMGFPKLYRAI